MKRIEGLDPSGVVLELGSRFQLLAGMEPPSVLCSFHGDPLYVHVAGIGSRFSSGIGSRFWLRIGSPR